MLSQHLLLFKRLGLLLGLRIVLRVIIASLFPPSDAVVRLLVPIRVGGVLSRTFLHTAGSSVWRHQIRRSLVKDLTCYWLYSSLLTQLLMIVLEEGTEMAAALRQTPPVTTYPVLGLYCKTSPPLQCPVLFYARLWKLSGGCSIRSAEKYKI